MNNLLLSAASDINESLRSRWFLVYSLIFGGIVVGLFVSGLSESRVMGFTGLSRLLVTYLQISMAILPIFVLISTVRSVAGDRESGIIEYMLSLPVGLAAWFWGKLLGRFIMVFSPVFLALLIALAWGLVKGAEIPWAQVFFYTGFLVSLAACFLGLGILISALTRSSDIATGAAFLLWLALLLFMDLILLGVLIRHGMPSEAVIGLALVNPLQVFRTASMMLFDPQLVLLGPSAYVILDHFGISLYSLWALIDPLLLGLLAAALGCQVFRSNDLP